MFWSMHTGIIAAIAVVFARYAAVFVPLDTMGMRIVAVGVIVLLSAINVFGVRHGGFVQNAFTAAKLLAIVVLVGAGVAVSGAPVVVGGAAAGDVTARGFILAIAAGLFAYGGWHMVTYAAGETKDARRTIPRALLIGTLIVTACYAGLNWIYLRVMPLEMVRASSRVAADAADVMFGGGAAVLVTILVLVSTFGAVNGIILAGPRVYYSMAQDGTIFRWLGAVHPRFGTPHRAILLQGAWAAVLAATNTYGALFSRVIYTEWIFFAAMAAGLMLLRRRRDYHPTYRVWGYPLIPIVFIVASLIIVAIQVANDPADSAIGLGMVLIGWPIYVVWSKRSGHDH
jgi:APA family basic amino acid/polyamine antiporter